MKIVLWMMGVLVMLAAMTFGTLIGARRTEKAFASLKVGDSRSEVMHVMGTPKQVGACGSLPHAKAGCATEMLFAHPLAPAVPEYWIVRLDNAGHVQETLQSTVRSSY